MITLEQIKDEYAVSKGYKDFDDLLISVINYEILSEQISEVMKIYARECLKLTSENAFNHFIAVSDIVKTNVRKAITNENNIIK